MTHHDNAQTAHDTSHYTYADCIKGIVPGPPAPNGAALFQILMVGGMVTFMVTINGIRSTGLGFVMNSHWLYPLVFCIAFIVRTFIGSKLAGFLASRVIPSRLTGTAHGIAMAALNVCCMAPIMAAIVTFLLIGTTDFALRYATTLPIIVPTGVIVNYFVVAPAVKLLFHNKISPAGGLGILSKLSQSEQMLSRLMGS